MVPVVVQIRKGLRDHMLVVEIRMLKDAETKNILHFQNKKPVCVIWRNTSNMVHCDGAMPWIHANNSLFSTPCVLYLCWRCIVMLTIYTEWFMSAHNIIAHNGTFNCERWPASPIKANKQHFFLSGCTSKGKQLSAVFFRGMPNDCCGMKCLELIAVGGSGRWWMESSNRAMGNWQLVIDWELLERAEVGLGRYAHIELTCVRNCCVLQ